MTTTKEYSAFWNTRLGPRQTYGGNHLPTLMHMDGSTAAVACRAECMVGDVCYFMQ